MEPSKTRILEETLQMADLYAQVDNRRQILCYHNSFHHTRQNHGPDWREASHTCCSSAQTPVGSGDDRNGKEYSVDMERLPAVCRLPISSSYGVNI